MPPAASRRAVVTRSPTEVSKVSLRAGRPAASSAELQRHLLEVSRRRLDDEVADLGRAGEGHLVDVVVLGQRRARVTEAGDDVDHAVGQSGLLEQLAQAQRRQRRLVGAATGSRRRTPGGPPWPVSFPREQRSRASCDGASTLVHF
jgi:hypothetical protein